MLYPSLKVFTGPGLLTLVGFHAMSTENENTRPMPTLDGSWNRNVSSHKPEALGGIYIQMFKDEIEVEPTAT